MPSDTDSENKDQNAWRLILDAQLESSGSDSSEDEVETLAVLIFHGVAEAQEHRQERQQHTRLYLTCGDLIPTPRIGTPWQVLYAT